MKYLCKTLILISVTLCYPFSDHSFGFNPAAQTGVKFVQDGCDRLREGLKEILLANEAPGGLVISHNFHCENMSFGAGTKGTDMLHERLDVLVQSVPTYRWRKRKGVVNVEPRTEEIKFLDTNVAQFTYNTSSNLDFIADSLKQASEVRRTMTSLNLSDGLYFGGLQSPPVDKAGSEIVLKSKTVRQILNDIVQRRGRGLWVYTERTAGQSRRFTLQFVIK